MAIIELLTKGPEDTRLLGREIGALLKSGDAVAIFGELGAGKTTLVKGLAEGAGITDFVSSPSFVIINEYAGRMPFYHIDLYRLEDEREIESLAIDEYFKGGGVVAIEWAERLKGSLPESCITIMIEPVNEHERAITIEEKAPNRFFGKIGKGD